MRRYPNAPIVEAVIELRLRFGDAPSIESLDGFCQRVADRFPSKVPMNLMAVGVAQKPGEEPQVQSNQSQIGFRLTSTNNDRIMLVQQASLAYSHLAPYSDWDTFLSELKSLWETFSEMVSPKAVVRVAARYINRIVIPEPKIEIKDFFNISAEFPETLAPHLSGFFVQLQLPHPDLHPNAKSVINFSSEPSAQQNTCSFLFDIDTFREDELAPNSNEIWEFLEGLRVKKDALFEASITDNTRALFQ